VSFDRVAPHYRWLETVVFGNQLQQARGAFVREIRPPRRALIVGEGDGRFLAQLLSTGEPWIDCVEVSAGMIALARKRTCNARVTFIQCDIRDLTLCEAQYDLLVSHFFLDCFTKGCPRSNRRQVGERGDAGRAMVDRRFLLPRAQLASLASSRLDCHDVFLFPRRGRH
jgi:SAM-dependent methyltransferase